MKKTLVAIALLLSVVSAIARGPTPTYVQSGAKFNVKFASNGTPVAAMTAGSSGVAVLGGMQVPLGASTVLNAVVSGLITGASFAGPWGAAVGALGVAAMFAVPALHDYYGKAKLSAVGDVIKKEIPGGASCAYVAPYGWTYAGDPRVTETWICKETSPGEYVWGFQQTCTQFAFCRGEGVFSPVQATYAVLAAPSLQTISREQAILEMARVVPTPVDAQALYDLNFPPQVVSVVPAGPATIAEPLKTTIQPDGGTRTDNCDYHLAYNGSDIDVTETCSTRIQTPGTTQTVTTTNPDGTTTTAVISTAPTDTTATTAQEKPAATSCGLPGSPACKIDETGTPDFKPDELQRKAEQSIAPTKSCLNGLAQCLPALSSLSWGFAFPTGCTNVVFPTIVARPVVIDVCQFVPTIHDLMSLLWAAAGLFGAVSLVFKDSVGG